MTPLEKQAEQGRFWEPGPMSVKWRKERRDRVWPGWQSSDTLNKLMARSQVWDEGMSRTKGQRSQEERIYVIQQENFITVNTPQRWKTMTASRGAEAGGPPDKNVQDTKWVTSMVSATSGVLCSIRILIGHITWFIEGKLLDAADNLKNFWCSHNCVQDCIRVDTLLTIFFPDSRPSSHQSLQRCSPQTKLPPTGLT